MAGKGVRGRCSWSVFLTLVILMGVTVTEINSQCTFPTSLQGNWYRAKDADVVTFSSTELSGLTIIAGSATYTDAMQCVESSGDKYILGTKTKVSGTVVNEYGYICWELVKQTDVTYVFYLLTSVASGGTFDNLNVFGSVSTTPSMSDVCSKSSSDNDVFPSIFFKVTSSSATDIATSSIATAQQQCSPSVFATYSYVTGSGDCSGVSSKLDFCVDRNTAVADYTACATKVLYSDGGELSCAATVTKGSDVFQLLINKDSSVDSATYYRFVCLKVTTSGSTETGTVYVKDCETTSPTQQLTLTRTVSCPITDTTTATIAASTGSSTNNGGGTDLLPIIIGAVVGAVVVLVAVVVAILLYKLVYVKRKNRAVTPLKPSRNGSVVSPTDPEAIKPDAPTPTHSEDPDATPRVTRLPPLEGNAPVSEPLRS